MKFKLQILILPITLFSIALLTGTVRASETEGTLTSGIGGTLGTTMTGVVIAPPVANPGAGAYTSAQSVTLVADGSSSIRYTTDGTAPTCLAGTVYTGAISIGSSRTIQAVSCYVNGATSAIASYAYAINIPAPAPAPAPSAPSGGGGGGGGGGSSCPSITVPTGGLGVDVTDNSPVQGSVLLMMRAGSDATRMAISNDPSFISIGIQTYAENIAWKLADDISGTKTVYVRFYNECGLYSLVTKTFVHQGLENPGTVYLGESGNSSGQVLGERWRNVTAEEIELTGKIDMALTKRLAGWILLQVEQFGQAWYVDIVSLMRYYLEDGNSAYRALEDFGLGITNADLEKIPVGHEPRFEMTDADADGLPDKLEEALGTNVVKADTDGDGVTDGVEVLENQTNPLGEGGQIFSTVLANRLSGRILLQVESRGEAWYVNPADNKRYYMNNGEAAYQIMRFLSLGITNDDIRKIPVGSLDE